MADNHAKLAAYNDGAYGEYGRPYCGGCGLESCGCRSTIPATIATAQRAAEALLTSIEAGISDLKRENALAVGSLVTLTDAPGGAIWRVLEIDGADALIESEGGRRFWRPVARLTVATGAFRTLNPAAGQVTVELVWSDGISRVLSDVHYQANSWHGSYHIRRAETGCHVSYEQSRDERGGALPIHFTALGTTPDMAGARALCAAHHAQFGADPR
jgi:hypothetical protein